MVDELEAGLLRLLAELLAKGTDLDARTWQAERLAELQWLKMRARNATARELDALERAIRDAVLDAYNHGTASALVDLDKAGRDVTPGGLPAARTALSLAAQPVDMVRRAAAMVPE